MASARMNGFQLCPDAVRHIPDGEEASVNFRDRVDRESYSERPNQKAGFDTNKRKNVGVWNHWTTN